MTAGENLHERPSGIALCAVQGEVRRLNRGSSEDRTLYPSWKLEGASEQRKDMVWTPLQAHQPGVGLLCGLERQ